MRRTLAAVLVAGALARVSDAFTTSEQRHVALNIYVEPGKEDRCAWAMDCLKAAMRWAVSPWICSAMARPSMRLVMELAKVIMRMTSGRS